MPGKPKRPYARDQDPGFGTELRRLICSTLRADRALAGIIVDEMGEICRLRTESHLHPKEDALHGELSRVHYLRLYPKGWSVRVYFVVIGRTVWMLGIDSNKRRDQMGEGTERRLHKRLAKVEQRSKGESK
jgi:hypothetical protein